MAVWYRDSVNSVAELHVNVGSSGNDNVGSLKCGDNDAVL